jgi:hypothetical protein
MLVSQFTNGFVVQVRLPVLIQNTYRVRVAVTNFCHVH